MRCYPHYCVCEGVQVYACLFVCLSGDHLALEYAPDTPTAGPLQNPYAFTLISEQFTLPHPIDPADT